MTARESVMMESTLSAVADDLRRHEASGRGARGVEAPRVLVRADSLRRKSYEAGDYVTQKAGSRW